VGVLARQQTFAYAVSLSRKLKSFAFRSLIRTSGFAALGSAAFVVKRRKKVLALTSSSNVTTRPIKQVYWFSLFHLFGNEKKVLFSFAFRSLIRTFARE
jgi:hypothetical protein